MRPTLTALTVPVLPGAPEYRVTEDALLPLGFELRATHFKAGQMVDVAGMVMSKCVLV